MFCKNCGKEISENSKFCDGCGSEVNKTVAKVKKSKTSSKINVKEIFSSLINSVINPISTMDENISKLNTTKATLIYAGILTVAMTLVNFLVKLILALFDKVCILNKCTTMVDNLDFVGLLLKQLVIYGGFVFGIAGVYYLANLIFKKSADYIKFLAISCVSIMPSIIGNIVVAPILGTIWSPLGVIVSTLATIYTLLILFIAFSKNIGFKNDDKKILFQAICLTIFSVINNYIYVSTYVSSISDSLSDLSNLFNF